MLFSFCLCFPDLCFTYFFLACLDVTNQFAWSITEEFPTFSFKKKALPTFLHAHDDNDLPKCIVVAYYCLLEFSVQALQG